jgi:methionine-R-sulfoxide reductase
MKKISIAIVVLALFFGGAFGWNYHGTGFSSPNAMDMPDLKDPGATTFAEVCVGCAKAGFGEESRQQELAMNINNSRPIKAQYVKPSPQEVKKRLTPLQYKVTQREGTERPFKNEYWDEKRDGIYVDIVSGEPLFSSKDKFKSGTGWPSFTRPIRGAGVVEKTDKKLFMTRVEVRSKIADSHLGHLFDDGPAPTGKRYCVNSASMRFIPSSQLQIKGYGKYASMFSR